MVTRIGSIDFGTKLKFAHESLMPGFVPFYRADLLIFIFYDFNPWNPNSKFLKFLEMNTRFLVESCKILLNLKRFLKSFESDEIF